MVVIDDYISYEKCIALDEVFVVDCCLSVYIIICEIFTGVDVGVNF